MCLVMWERGRRGKRASVSSSGVLCTQKQGWVERARASSSRQSSAGTGAGCMQQCSNNASKNVRKSGGMRAAVGHAVGTRMPRSGGAARGSGRTAAALRGVGRPGSVAFGGHLFWPGIHAYFSVQVLVYRKVGSETLTREAGSFPEKSPEPHGPHANPAIHHGIRSFFKLFRLDVGSLRP